jgi:cytoskeletal protein RodZ
VVVVAALIGGLAADRLGHASILIAVIVSLVVGALGVLWLFRSPARPSALASDYPEDDETRDFRVPQHRHAPTRPRPQPAPRTAAPPAVPPVPPVAPAAAADPVAPGSPGGAGTVVELLPVSGQAGAADAPWWDSAQGAPAPSAGAKRAPAPDLSSYLASTFIAQCPRCGAFRLDHRRARDGWDFRCEACDHVWTWRPGTPWPPVRVMPGGARPPAP